VNRLWKSSTSGPRPQIWAIGRSGGEADHACKGEFVLVGKYVNLTILQISFRP
jgi:hypothetical protein